MAEQAKEYMSQLKTILAELKVVNARAKELREQKKKTEAKIMEYLTQTDHLAVKYGDIVVAVAESTVHSKLKKKEKEENAIKVLEDNGIQNAEEVYKAIQEASMGEKETKHRLKVKSVVPEIF